VQVFGKNVVDLYLVVPSARRDVLRGDPAGSDHPDAHRLTLLEAD
jgi:hypothetical protein